MGLCQKIIMQTKYKIVLGIIGLILLFVVGLSFQKLVLERGANDTPINIVPQNNPPVLYNTEKSEQLERIFQTRPALSAPDKFAKDKLIQKPNPLFETEEFYIEYLSAPDEFMVEIKTKEIGKAKEEVEAWFVQQGFSTDGICKLPVVFYLNYEVAESLRGVDMEFDPLPLGC